MATRKRWRVEQIIGQLREAEVLLSQGEKVAGVCRKMGGKRADLLPLA